MENHNFKWDNSLFLWAFSPWPPEARTIREAETPAPAFGRKEPQVRKVLLLPGKNASKMVVKPCETHHHLVLGPFSVRILVLLSHIFRYLMGLRYVELLNSQIDPFLFFSLKEGMIPPNTFRH